MNKLSFSEIQKLSSDWSKKNFGDHYGTGYRNLLGLSEEVGELCHAHLKGEQKIRHTPEEIIALKKDAIGDIIIFLGNYCDSQNIDMGECVEAAWNVIKDKTYAPNYGGRISEPRLIFRDNQLDPGLGENILSVWRKDNNEYLGYIDWFYNEKKHSFKPANQDRYIEFLSEILLKINELDLSVEDARNKSPYPKEIVGILVVWWDYVQSAKKLKNLHSCTINFLLRCELRLLSGQELTSDQKKSLLSLLNGTAIQEKGKEI